MILNKEQAEVIGEALRQTFVQNGEKPLTSSQALRLTLCALLPHSESMSLLSAAGARIETLPDGKLRVIVNAIERPRAVQ